MLYEKIYPEFMEKTQKEKYREIIAETKLQGKVLDVACGPGFGVEIFPHAIFTDKNLEYLRAFKGLRVLANANFLPFHDKSFDTVVCIDFIHLMKNTAELNRVSNKTIIASEFCNENNYKEKFEHLKNIFWNVKKEFVVKTEKEWDAVIVAQSALTKRRLLQQILH